MARIQGYPRFRHILPDGSPAVGYKLASFLAGTTTPTPLYTSQDQTAQHPNPVILDGNGEAAVWLAPNIAYKLVLRTTLDADVWTLDNIQTQEGGFFTTLTVTGAATFATISASGQITSTVAIGTAPFVVASTTKVVNLNADLLKDKTWAAPGPIGQTTPDIATFGNLVAAAGTFTGVLLQTAAIPTIEQDTANAAIWQHRAFSEEITLSTSGTTTDSTQVDLLPANSIIEAVVARVTQTIAVATDWKLGDATQPARFLAAQSGAQLVAGATAVGLLHKDPTVATANLGPVQTADAKLRITTTGTPTTGKIRVTVFFKRFVAPAS